MMRDTRLALVGGKICTKCKCFKDWESFYNKGQASHCKVCVAARNALRKEAISKANRDYYETVIKPDPSARAYRNEQRKIHYQRNREKRLAYHRAYWAAHRDKLNAAQRARRLQARENASTTNPGGA